MSNKTKQNKKEIDFELRNRKKPKVDTKYDPLRKNKKFYMQKSYE